MQSQPLISALLDKTHTNLECSTKNEVKIKKIRGNGTVRNKYNTRDYGYPRVRLLRS